MSPAFRFNPHVEDDGCGLPAVVSEGSGYALVRRLADVLSATVERGATSASGGARVTICFRAQPY